MAKRTAFFFYDTATTEIYTLSLHDALPISIAGIWDHQPEATPLFANDGRSDPRRLGILSNLRHCKDRKSTRLNSSHMSISYAVFCLKKKTRLNLLTGTRCLQRKTRHRVQRD